MVSFLKILWLATAAWICLHRERRLHAFTKFPNFLVYPIYTRQKFTGRDIYLKMLIVMDTRVINSWPFNHKWIVYLSIDRYLIKAVVQIGRNIGSFVNNFKKKRLLRRRISDSHKKCFLNLNKSLDRREKLLNLLELHSLQTLRKSKWLKKLTEECNKVSRFHKV